MTTERDVYEIDASGAVASLDKLSKSMNQAWKEAEQAKSGISEMGDLFARDLQQSIFSATAAYDMLSKSVQAVGQFVMDGVHNFIEAEQANMRLTVALNNVGGMSATLVARLQAQNSVIQRATGIDDDYLTSLQAMLTTMGVAPEMLERFTQAAVNLAQATGQDAKIAAQQLARANAEGREDLKKYGIEIDEAAFAARGFTVVLDEVERRLTGISDQQPEIVKQTNALKGAWSDLGEAVGEAAIKFVSMGEKGDIVVSLIDRITASIKNADMAAVRFKSVIPGMINPFLAVSGMASAAWDLLGNDAPAPAPQPAQADFSPGPANHLKGFSPEEQSKKAAKEKEKHYKTSIDAAKKYREEMNALSINSSANLQKLEDEENRKMMERVTKMGDWEVLNEQERIKTNFQIAQDNIEILKSEEEQRKAILDKRLEREKQHWEEMKQAALGALENVVAAQFGFVRDMLLSNTEYNRQLFEQQLERKTAGMEEAQVQEERAKMEKQLAEERGAAYLKMTADALANIAQQAAVKAVMEGVEAIASVAVGDVAGAALHGTAAAGYAGVALLAGGTAAALSTARGMTTEERTQLENGNKADKERKTREAQAKSERAQAAGTIVNVYNLGITGQTEIEQGKELSRIQKQYEAMKTGGA